MLPDANDASAVLDADATRRAFLKKVAIGGAVAAVGTQVLPFDRLVPRASGQEDDATADLTPDEQVMTFLASLALAGAAVYRAATGDEATGTEGDEEEEGDSAETTVPATTLPPIQVPVLAEPVVEILRVFGSHHAGQAAGLNGQVSVAAEEPNGTLQDELRSALGGAADEAALLAVLRDFEERLAATHLAALGELEDITDAGLVASALPIVAQHAVVLGLIGSTPVDLEELIPEEQTTDDALTDDDYPVEVTEGSAPEAGPEQPNAGGEGADGGDGNDAPSGGDGTESSGGGADTGTSDDSGTAGDQTGG